MFVCSTKLRLLVLLVLSTLCMPTFLWSADNVKQEDDGFHALINLYEHETVASSDRANNRLVRKHTKLDDVGLFDHYLYEYDVEASKKRLGAPPKRRKSDRFLREKQSR